MKLITAFIHRGRVADIVQALREAKFKRISLNDVTGLLRALSTREQGYSVELGEQVTMEIHLELFCEDAQVDQAVQIMRKHGRTGQRDAGWIYVMPVDAAFAIDSRDGS
jgi:nitrogen regulatory protein P-II 1